MSGQVRAFRVTGPAAASLLVNALIVLALLGLQIGPSADGPRPRLAKVVTFAVRKGTAAGEEAAEAPNTPQPSAVPLASNEPLAPNSQSVAIAELNPSVVALLPAPAVPLPSPPMPASAAVPSPSSAPMATAIGAVLASGQHGGTVRKGAADGFDTKAPAGPSRSYAAKVRSWLYAHKVYPRRARMQHEEGLVYVRFVLDRQGVLLEGAVVRPSGNSLFDDEAEAMLRRSSPYPRAPADLPGERIEFTAPIEFALAA